MISSNITITLHDDKFKKLLSMRGAFPVNQLCSEEYIDWVTGVGPSPSQDNYRVVDVLKVIHNLKRSNFIELLFGVPKEEVEPNTRKLF